MRYVQVQAYECTQAVDILIHGQQHFETDENQYDTKSVFQILEVFSHSSQGKIQGTESEDGKDVGSEHNERISTDAEHSWNAVNGKSNISGLDDQQGYK